MSTDASDFDYDADHAPDPRAWLATAFAARARGVRRYHERAAVDHPQVRSPELHAAVHVAVENQIALGRPAATARAVERLVAAGLPRHEAIHRVGAVVGAGYLGVMEGQRPLDEDALARALDALSAAG